MARRARAPIETAEVTSAGGETVTVDGVARRQRTITAAATVLDIANRKVIKRLKTTRQDWQDEAWEYYDTNPLVGFGADFIANAMSRFRFYIAWQSDVSDWPNEIDPDNIPPELDERAYKTAQDTLSRFDAGQGLMEMARKAAYCLSLPGEFFVVGREERLPNGQTRERFDSYSASEIDLSKADKGIIEIKTSPSANEREVIKIDPERSVVFRVWRPHPRYGQLASTPMRRVLEMCEEQGLLRRYMRGASRSRLNAGILEVPIEWKLGPTENTNDQGEQYDKLADDLVSALMTGIEDEASAATVVPYVVHAPADSLGKARLITFARDFDKLSLEIRARLDQEIASGLDLPDQVLLGLGQVKFRNAEVITAEQAKLHLEPLAVVLVRSWSVGFLYPAMEAEGIEPEISRQFTIWYDAAAVTSDPDQSQSSNFGVENDMISDDAWRRANNYTDEDAPSEEDIARRATRRTANRPVAPGDEEEDADGFPFGLAAAGRTSGPVERLGRRMATAESIVRLKVQLAADTAMRRAFERIGAASRQRAGTQAHLMKGIDNAAIVTRLGMETVIRLGVNPEQHLSLELSRLRERYLELVQAHQYSIVAMISDASKTPLEKLTERTAASWARAVDHSWVEMQGRLLKVMSCSWRWWRRLLGRGRWSRRRWNVMRRRSGSSTRRSLFRQGSCGMRCRSLVGRRSRTRAIRERWGEWRPGRSSRMRWGRQVSASRSSSGCTATQLPERSRSSRTLLWMELCSPGSMTRSSPIRTASRPAHSSTRVTTRTANARSLRGSSRRTRRSSSVIQSRQANYADAV
jgi:hypothetical protein